MPHVHASVSVTTEPTTADVLRDVRDLLADPARWIRAHFALASPDAEPDESLYGNEDGATCFCVLGALQRVTGLGPVGTYDHPAKRLIEKAITDDPRASHGFGKGNISTFNDHPETRHVDILDALDRAVSAAVLAETK